MTEFTENVIGIISIIPKGKVMTYGLIARYSGNYRGSRQISRILTTLSKKYNLPWHRVINSRGEISLKGEAGLEQKSLLVDEGIIFENDKIDLNKYLYEIK